jgi:hypothetical protein
MMDLPKIAMPVHADSQRQYLYWEEDQMFTFLACLTGGIALDLTWPMLVFGLIVAYALERMKSTYLPGFAQHILFRLGMPLNKVFTNGMARTFIA